ncbi:MAG: TldD/PmbA family protein [Gemmatimonadaceae bacterium]
MHIPPSRDELQALAKRALSFTTADEARVNISAGWSGNTRFAASEITTAGGITDISVNITTTFGKRRASATTNILEDASLKRTVGLAERLAKLAPDDPEIMPELQQQSYAAVDGFNERTANLTPEDRALAARRVIDSDAVKSGSLKVAGFIEANAAASAVATSKGLFAYHRNTDVSMSTTVRTPDGTGSGWASAGSRSWSDINPAALGERATRKAIQSQNPRAIEPGQYTVVLEAQAVADLVPLLAGSFSARQADEGRSPFSKKGGGTKIGEKITDERITMFSDPSDSQLATQPFDSEGSPVARTVWVENGVLKNLVYSRYWAQKQGKQPTAGAGGGGGGGFGGGPAGGLKIPGGTKSVDELVAGTERGILITHFFYIRFLDPRTVLLTGLTRDGTFLIEGGKITRSLKNFRWNESPLFMLNKLDELGRAERVSASLVVPSMRVRDFTFTSLSDAV